MNRLYMKAGNNVAGIIAGYNFKSLTVQNARVVASFVVP